MCMAIMFVNKHELLTTIYKDIQFRRLFPLANKTKEEC